MKKIAKVIILFTKSFLLIIDIFLFQFFECAEELDLVRKAFSDVEDKKFKTNEWAVKWVCERNPVR